MNTIYKKQEDVIQNRELHHYILDVFGLHSKKKRVRKKLFKQVLEQETLLNKVVKDFHQEADAEGASKEEASPIDFSVLPVTTLLKLGKEFFKEEDAIRFYYNKNKPEQYKNKELLIACISTSFQSSSLSIQKEIANLLS
ncbi:hypothetical protein [Niallia sp. NCCP-28]|uniref:hypothetical protein n=1 Tax=Niallia sp. NCCP-28 TaxID=2934712 RepID=UPI00207E0052|nr:hypothetical protein [Niallia sp. NCCP-28]GKU81890.1 hypothetical protein NCCP28_12860 [Niallia sp. NCCP-28]